MSKQGFTPGPWAVEIGHEDCPFINIGGRYAIAKVYRETILNGPLPAAANANLIAAAPDLLEALETALKFLEISRRRRVAEGLEGPGLDRAIEMASAAIFKAKGEA